MLIFLKSRLLISLFCICIGGQSAWAQLNNKVLEEGLSFESERKNALFLKLTNFNFVRNNEYFNDIVSGQTFFGYQLAPTLIYYPTASLRLEAGAFFWKDFGNPDYSLVAPIFSLKYFKDSLSIIFGNLEGNVQHHLIEPLYAFERTITHHLENGLQVKYNKGRFYGDLWIDWQRAIYANSPFQEEISAGLVAAVSPFKNQKFELQIPFQMSIVHRGGQDLGIAATNALNLTTGINLHWRNTGNRFFKQIRSENYWVYGAREVFDTLTDILQERVGQGLYLNLSAETRLFELMLSYWYGRKFDAVQGGDLYKSYPVKPQGIFQPTRRLLFVRLFKDFKVMNELYFTLRFEPYYDFVEKRVEHAAGFYISYRPSFFLLKTKDFFK
jgi:hypothetical protein